MITLEKLLLLKSVPFFQNARDELLLHIVTTAVKEQCVTAGELIVNKNDAGTDLYVVASGHVRVHNGDILVNMLSDRDIFGELSALLFQPHISSVSAITECLLLKINGQTLCDIMHFDVGLMKSIIHALCERAQSMSQQIQMLMTKE